MGYQQSLRPAQAGLMLNIDTAATAFLEEQPLTQYLMRSLNKFNEQALMHMDQGTYRKAAKAVSGIRVGI